MQSTFWLELADARQDKFYQGLNSVQFDEAPPEAQLAFLQLHLGRMRQNSMLLKLYPEHNDLTYYFNALIILFWNAVIRRNRPAYPQIPQSPPSNNTNLVTCQLIIMFNSEKFDKAGPAERKLLTDFTQQSMRYSPSVYNLNLYKYWNPVIRANRGPPPYLQPELVLNQIRISGDFEQDLNSAAYDQASEEEIRRFVRYNFILSGLSVEKFRLYVYHIFQARPRRNRILTLDELYSTKQGIRLMNYPWPRDSVIEDTEVYGTMQDAQDSCEMDEDGVVDPISFDPIPSGELVRIRTAGALRCYALSTLIDINNSTGIDPFSRIPFARDLRDGIFALQLRRQGLQETADTRRFGQQAEDELQNLEGVLNQNNNPVQVDNYRRVLNELRLQIRNAVITELTYPNEEFLRQMRDHDTIGQAVRTAINSI